MLTTGCVRHCLGVQTPTVHEHHCVSSAVNSPVLETTGLERLQPLHQDSDIDFYRRMYRDEDHRPSEGISRECSLFNFNAGVYLLFLSILSFDRRLMSERRLHFLSPKWEGRGSHCEQLVLGFTSVLSGPDASQGTLLDALKTKSWRSHGGNGIFF